MKSSLMLLAILLLAACGEPAPVETVESLVANPERLEELREQCRVNRDALGDELCNTVTEATRSAFVGDGKVPYTPPSEKPAF